ncbi:hypothetical protein BDC45DRAFT_533061 [Circinella umbellata]|nr:hypothetical protein BDC45DRAFT_533061 [Circinella umbellata]
MPLYSFFFYKMGKRYNDIRFEYPQGTTQEPWTQGTLKIVPAVLGTTIIIKKHMSLLAKKHHIMLSKIAFFNPASIFCLLSWQHVINLVCYLVGIDELTTCYSLLYYYYLVSNKKLEI